MVLHQNLSNAINTIFLERKQTLTNFARELDISRCCLHDILNGTANPRLDTVEHIAKNLNLDSQALISSSSTSNQLQFFSALLPADSVIQKLPDEKQVQFVSIITEMMNVISDSNNDSLTCQCK